LTGFVVGAWVVVLVAAVAMFEQLAVEIVVLKPEQ
jgi:hypothetical protein